MRYLAVALALFCMSSQAAQTPLTLAPGEMAALRFGDDSEVSVERAAAQPLSAFERSTAASMAPGGVNAGASGSNYVSIPSPAAGAPPPVEPGVIRFSMLRLDPEGHILLVIENGYDQALRYRAQMQSGERAQMTDVCLTKPNRRNYEHWPYLFDRIVITDVRLAPWRDGDPAPCE